eukprot:562515-Pelagomonas_calceolata.AAC.1
MHGKHAAEALEYLMSACAAAHTRVCCHSRGTRSPAATKDLNCAHEVPSSCKYRRSPAAARTRGLVIFAKALKSVTTTMRESECAYECRSGVLTSVQECLLCSGLLRALDLQVMLAGHLSAN